MRSTQHTWNVLKTFEIQQYIGVFVIAELLDSSRPMLDPWLSDPQRGTIR